LSQPPQFLWVSGEPGLKIKVKVEVECGSNSLEDASDMQASHSFSEVYWFT
jgi:hypothetical protein